MSEIDRYEHFLWNCPEVNVTRHDWRLFNIGSGNELVLSGDMPFIACASVDTDLCHHMMSLGPNELNKPPFHSSAAFARVEPKSYTSGLYIKGCPGHVDIILGHIKCLWLLHDCDFQLGTWLFSSSRHPFYRAHTNIGWACENFCRVCTFLEPHALWTCTPKCLMLSPILQTHERSWWGMASPLWVFLEKVDTVKGVPAWCLIQYKDVFPG